MCSAMVDLEGVQEWIIGHPHFRSHLALSDPKDYQILNQGIFDRAKIFRVLSLAQDF